MYVCMYVKFANPSDTMLACMECAPPFSLQGFPNSFVNFSPHRCVRNFDGECEVEFFLHFCCVELFRANEPRGL